MKKDGISDLLLLYEAESSSPEAKRKLKKEIEEMDIRRVPPFSTVGFFGGVVRSLTPGFFVISLFYLAAVIVINFVCEQVILPVFSCIAAPFIALGTVWSAYYSGFVHVPEAESTCLYKPETVFAGRLVLCAVYDLAVVCVGSVMSGRFLYTLALSLSAFLFSCVAVMSLCIFLRVRTVIELLSGVLSLLAALFFSQTGAAKAAREFLLGITPGSLAPVLAVLAVAAVLISLISVKNFSYERMAAKYEA